MHICNGKASKVKIADRINEKQKLMNLREHSLVSLDSGLSFNDLSQFNFEGFI